MNVAIIGGGAAGFFSAIHVKKNYPEAEVHIFEKSNKLLSKVKLSGGGRCNLSHDNISNKEWLEAYPRGRNLLKKSFRIFNHKDAMQWFEEKGIALHTQDDGCVFPVAQDSQVIIDVFLKKINKQKTQIHLKHQISSITEENGKLRIYFQDQSIASRLFDKIIVATGGSPKMQGLKWLASLGHKIESPVPSLFTFNMPNETITKLMGIVIENVKISLQTSKLQAQGTILITHWGMSGPVVLKLSSLAAPVLNEKNYQFKIQINWVNIANNDHILEELQSIATRNPNKMLSNYRPYQLPERLWLFLLNKCGLPSHKKWQELGKKGINKLINILSNDIYTIDGKTTFKEEFVTCGGISLQEIHSQSLQSKRVPHLYFAGEILDIDGITGGFNLQAAWTTGFIAAQLG